MEPFHRMARLATIRGRRSLELSAMFVAMAVGAPCELDFELRRAPGGNVALRTFHTGVFALKWIRRFAVLR